MKTTKTAITLALSTALGAAGSAAAGGNPFAMQVLDRGYMVAGADGKATDGTCGGKKAQEAKCGANKDTAKAAEGNCGASKNATKTEDGKCGANKGKDMDHSGE